MCVYVHHRDAMRSRNSGKNHSRGQALVEAALVLPVFLLIPFAVFDFGRGVYAVQHDW